jgi:Predicted Zn peptidase
MDAVNEAKKVLKKYGKEGKNPIDLLRVAKGEKVYVMHAYFDYTSIFGVIKKNSDGIFIFLNEGESERRQRLMLAHILGHYFMHLSAYKEIQFYCDYHYSSDWVNQKEKEADQFAHQLLMPETQVKKMSVQGSSIEEMEDAFQVPASAMKERLEQVTGTNGNGKQSEDQFTLR